MKVASRQCSGSFSVDPLQGNFVGNLHTVILECHYCIGLVVVKTEVLCCFLQLKAK